MHPERSTTVTSAGVLFTNHEVQSRHCRHVCWLPVLQGLFHLMESHINAFTRVGEKDWSWFPCKLQAGAKLLVLVQHFRGICPLKQLFAVGALKQVELYDLELSTAGSKTYFTVVRAVTPS